VNGFPIVGIGTSAGGLQALRSLFETMPPDSGMAFVVVQHLYPAAESHLAEILSRTTAIPVVSIEDGMRVERNHIYTVVPDRYLHIIDGVLRLERPTERSSLRSPIDIFFRSLAEDQAERAICLVLSGAGTNGTAGVRAIKGAGGLALAQDPATAQYPTMPISASNIGMADSVLSPTDMPKALMSYLRTGLREARNPDQGADSIDGVLALILVRTGHDFRGYKKTTIDRRIRRRMGLAHLEDVSAYLSLLRERPHELHMLVRDLLINVTSFFRDPDAWENVAGKVIAPLVESTPQTEPLRIWVPACATGEEAYSIGMLVLEALHARGLSREVKIFATDAEQEVIAFARAGLYPASIVADVSKERLEAFFDREGDNFRVKRSLREMMTFAPQNLLRDPPFSHMDFISCRNLLIYLEPKVQRRVAALLHFALREGGYLCLSTAETMNDVSDLFEAVSNKWRIYRRIGATRHDLVDFSSSASRSSGSAPARPVRSMSLADHARLALADLYAPPSVLVDRDQRVLLFHGDLSRFLRQPPGQPTDQLMELAHDGLRGSLRAIVHQATRTLQATSTRAKIKRDDGYLDVTMAATPVNGALDRCLLVSFATNEVEPGRLLDEPNAEAAGNELEAELRSAREALRATVEQLEVSNEELKASNEEITSMNEELQSTNEELETSREELQSLNEELTTVNAQLQSKVVELEDRTNDLNNLLKSTDIATLFLDSAFNIKGFTPAVLKLMNVIPADIGRPLGHLTPRFDDPRLASDAADVLATLQPSEAEIRDEHDRWYLRRIVPYRTDDNRIAGVVITFVDITERRRSETELQHAKEYAETIVDSVRHPLVVLDRNLAIQSVNDAFCAFLGRPEEEIVGKPFEGFVGGPLELPAIRELIGAVQAKDLPKTIEIEVPAARRGGRIMEMHASRLGSAQSTLIAIEDVTAQRMEKRQLRVMMSDLLHRIRNILANVRAIAAESREHATSLPEFWESFSGRLDALASIHTLLATRKDARVSLEELLLEELRAYAPDDGRRYVLSGPPLELRAEAAQAIAMLIHELATNAAKYGALSVPGGQISVSWGLEDRSVIVDWIERGLPRKPRAERRGFGTTLIEESLRYTMGGRSALHFNTDGIACELELPLGEHVQVGAVVQHEHYPGV
jgi:two-component system CheB/CheR fusion protein